jgi:GDSL-like lipase/acylhydrolase family protein
MSISLRVAAALALVASVAACTDNSAKVLGPTPSGNGLFASYVSLGNSITAGMQSGGINDSTQKRSYAVLLAGQMGTRFAYPSLAMPGCPPPVANFLTQARATTPTSGTTSSNSCFLRANTAATLNNVAVPGATVLDPDAPSGTPFSNLLTQLILGGESQVQRAREANPTFATVWIGNNDVLAAAVSGLLSPVAGVSPGVTPQATFQSSYDKLITDLTAGENLKGVLIGVVNVTSVPILFSAQLLQNPQFVGALSQAAGKTITVDPTTCTATSASLISFQIVAAIKANQHPATIACEKSPNPQFPLLGDIFVLDSGEIATLTSYITAVNSYIGGKAQSIGFAYLDPNKALDSLKALGQINPLGPNFAAPTAPFGKWISLDGVHPTAAAHQLITNYLIDVINSKYSTTLVKLPNP